ncbi:hypothetical protein ACJ41O_009653 [Fusarium nematophilum]
MDDATGGRAPLFADCAVAFLSSNSLTPKLIGQLSSLLKDNGATICEPRRDGSIPMEKITHIISNTIDFPQFTESQALMMPVVTTQWITSSITRGKQAQIRPFSPDPRMIFSEVVVTCADIPESDRDSILGATMALGGQESKDATKITTHICALSMKHPKVRAALQRGWKGKVVLPHWFDDCFKLGKRIDESPYLLPNPEIVKKSSKDEVKLPFVEDLVLATSATPTYLPLPADDDVVRPPATVFQDHRVMLLKDLNITKRLTKIIRDIIVNGGGKMVSQEQDCTMLICQYRDDPAYVKAAQSCKHVGNLSWLFWLIVHNDWTSPLRRLLHYPVPRNGIQGFQGMRITVSNYGGEARTYLENLIKACGAEFTKTMRADNTHLITARDSSEKCRAAPEWGVAVVNHLWIEESYAKCELRPINIKKFNHFPPRTNLSEIIGQVFFDESKLRELYYPGGEAGLSPDAKRKRRVLEVAEENAYQRGPAEGVVIGRVREVRDVDGLKEETENEDPAKRKTTETEADNATTTPTRLRRRASDTPTLPSPGGRSAKAKARDMLLNIAPDIALYEKEKKRHSKAGNGPWGGKRAADQAEKASGSKQAKSPEGEDDAATRRPAKKARQSLPSVEMRVILTGFARWVGDKNKEDQDRKKLRDLGIQIVQEGQACDYLAAPHIVRTVKFLCAMARGPTVISSAFIERVLEMGKVPDVQKFILEDKELEDQFNFNLEKSVARAKANRGRLLMGIAIYCTEKVKIGPDSYKAIAEANGGIFKVYRARGGSTIRPATAEEDGDEPPEPVYLLSGFSSEERQLWPRFREMALKGNMEPRIVAPDWLIDVAMAQEVRFDEKFLVGNYYVDQM